MTTSDPAEHTTTSRARVAVAWNDHAGRTDAALNELYALADQQLTNGVWARSTLSRRERRLVTLTALALGSRTDSVIIHTRSALYRGDLTPNELEELCIHIAAYAGWPTANALGKIVEQEVAAWLDDGAPVGETAMPSPR